MHHSQKMSFFTDSIDEQSFETYLLSHKDNLRQITLRQKTPLKGIASGMLGTPDGFQPKDTLS